MSTYSANLSETNPEAARAALQALTDHAEQLKAQLSDIRCGLSSADPEDVFNSGCESAVMELVTLHGYPQNEAEDDAAMILGVAAAFVADTGCAAMERLTGHLWMPDADGHMGIA
ncbi:hypothetical protein [Streptomyces albireticuli]|uniref:Uncharacterized protein n=1 Tax=Streptomyces albireticuli TaxID=1940 RepID=A0A2A2D2Q4_9ACTN|nr:hypothetical protein [Streptomyces albireticuli]MCD9196215.1 hypothetical protein [Streptomyces albireticuli]PAU46713.1 hypothetical protein CK936_22610 [Streptomyces albireticuli]